MLGKVCVKFIQRMIQIRVPTGSGSQPDPDQDGSLKSWFELFNTADNFKPRAITALLCSLPYHYTNLLSVWTMLRLGFG
jgi:hypothetical protein